MIDALLISYLVLGSIAGILAGLMGIGGGLVIVPTLIILFTTADINPDYIAHTAVGTSLTTIIPTSISSLIAHQKKGAIQWGIVKRLTIGLLFGAVFGAWLADKIPTDGLTQIIGVFAILVGIYMLTKVTVKTGLKPFDTFSWKFSGGIIGTISSIVGIGGGSMTVPLLLAQKVDMRKAIATSAACGLPIAIAGSLGFFYFSYQETNSYIHWPATLTISIASILSAPIGAMLAHSLPVSTLKRIFAVLLLIVGAKLLF